MPRIRTVKPEFWLNEDLAEQPPETRLLAIGLLNQSDDEGYFKANPAILKGAIFPLSDTSVSVHTMLTQLSTIGYINIYKGVDKRSYGQVVNFAKHQVVNRPSPSKIKDLIDFNEGSLSNHGAINEDSVPERKGKEQGKERKDTAPRKRGPILLSTFLDECKQAKEKPIPKDHSVFTYCEDAGIPDEFLALCWREFKEKSIESGKKYKDWRKAFKNCVRDNWYRLWWFDDNNQCLLTSKGRQADQVQVSREVSHGA